MTFGTAIREYLIALSQHWRAGITGGFGSALVTACTVMGHIVQQSVGMAFVVGTLLVASFDAWREEHTQVNELTRAANREEARAPRIDDVAVNHNPHNYSLTVYVVNPGEPTSFIAPFALELIKPDGTVHHATGTASAHQLHLVLALGSPWSLTTPLMCQTGRRSVT